MRRKGCSEGLGGDTIQTEVFQGILIPFLGTTLGSACVLFMKNRLNQMVQRVLTGFAAGVVYAGWLSGDAGITAMGALALSLGIAIQNFPEGAVISIPLRAEGVSKGKAFLYGMLSGAVEPVGAALTILAAGFVVPLLPYLLSFAAGPWSMWSWRN